MAFYNNYKNNYKSKKTTNIITDINNLSEKDLAKRLILTMLGTISLIVMLLIGVIFFGPQIGAFFGFLSINRGNNTTKDTTAPEAPILYNFPEATKESTTTIKVYSESGSKIKLFVNGPEVQSVVADAQAQGTFTDVQLIEGKNTIFAKAVDAANNESEKSKTIFIEVDTTKPKLEVISPKKDEIVRNLDKRILIKGKLSEKATLKINDKMAIVKPDLTFEFLLGVEEGTIEIKVEATDTAGNVASEKFKVKYERRGV